jgi:hypothetical protein
MGRMAYARRPRRLARLGRASCAHSSWRAGGSSTQRPSSCGGVSDWLFSSAAVVIVGVAITTAYPLSIAHVVPRVSMGNPRDCAGARLKGGGTGLRFGVWSNECGVQGWIFSWASRCTPGSSGNQSESRYRLVPFYPGKVSARFGPRPEVPRVFRRATANVLRERCPPVQLPCGLDTILSCIACFLRACREDTSAGESLYHKYLLRGNRCFKCQAKAKAALALAECGIVCAR